MDDLVFKAREFARRAHASLTGQIIGAVLFILALWALSKMGKEQ